MTAILSASVDAMKRLYPKGEPANSVQSNYKFFKSLDKMTEFDGELMHVPLQISNPAGSGPSVPVAQGSLAQSLYKKFSLTRVSHFSIARISGELLLAAKGNAGSFVDLWKNESECAARTAYRKLSTHLFGSGNGVLGRVLSGTASTTVTMYTGTNMNYFEIGDRVVMVDGTGTSPTLLAGSATVTGVDRRARTLSFASAFSSTVSGATDGYYLCHIGENMSAGSGTVMAGLGSYVEGGTSPSTLFGLVRTSDPQRLAGQAIDYTGIPMEDAVADASAQSGYLGTSSAKILVANNIEVSNMKKSMSSKIVYDRNSSAKAQGSFEKVWIEGDSGLIEVIADPFCPREKAYLLDKAAFTLCSLKGAPHKDNYAGSDVMLLQSDDVYEMRWKFYGNLRCKNPAPHVQLQNFGV